MEELVRQAPMTCSYCGNRIDDSGYVPANGASDGYEFLDDHALCVRCSFSEVGYAGCAPEPGDLLDAGVADALLQVKRVDDGYEVLTAKE